MTLKQVLAFYVIDKWCSGDRTWIYPKPICYFQWNHDGLDVTFKNVSGISGESSEFRMFIECLSNTRFEVE